MASEPRQDWTFAELFGWHLDHGTRPQPSDRPWTPKEFAYALERETNERTIRKLEKWNLSAR